VRCVVVPLGEDLVAHAGGPGRLEKEKEKKV
jgi:hypothetical protein